MIVDGVAASILGRPRATRDKAIAQRPQDLRDIEGLLDVHPDANVEHVRQWLREFATAIAMPELFEHFETLLRQRKPRQ